MMFIPQILFIVAFAIFLYFFTKRILFIRRNILLGKDEDLRDSPGERWKNMALFSLGQKKMFARPIPAFFHMMIYIGFIIINLEVLEIVLDGILGTHRIFFAVLGELYGVFISAFEILAVLVIVACVAFLARRYILRIRRFFGKEMTSWAKTDATLILVFEIILMVLFLLMNAADYRLQQYNYQDYVDTGQFIVSRALSAPLAGASPETLFFLERLGWWGHIIGIFGFAIYVTYSKHLHIFLAFPNTYYTRLKPKGKMENMPAITKEVQYALGLATPEAEGGEEAAPPSRFGAKDVQDLSWKNLLDAYSCTECGRCADNCPANITGKKLSPRKIMMDTRARVEEVGYNIDKHGKDHDDGKTLLHDHITLEELNACTTCQACVEACPVNIDPLNIILELRRYQIMEESSAPQEWNFMFQNVETNFAPWKFSPDDRMKWAE